MYIYIYSHTHTHFTWRCGVHDLICFIASDFGLWSVPLALQMTVRSIFWTLDRKYAMTTQGVRNLWYAWHVASGSLPLSAVHAAEAFPPSPPPVCAHPQGPWPAPRASKPRQVPSRDPQDRGVRAGTDRAGAVRVVLLPVCHSAAHTHTPPPALP
jgi:hypothetical protein